MRSSSWHLSSLLALALAVLALATWSPPVLADQPVPPAQGQVTLPLESFLQMVRKPGTPAGGQAGPAVPVPFLFSRGQYRLEARPDWVQVQGELELQVYQPGWVEVPLLPADLVLEEARLDGAPLALYRKEGRFFLPVERTGSHKLQVTWNLPVRLDGATRSADLQTPPSSVSGFVLVIPDRGLELKTSPSLPLTRQDEGTRTLFRGTIPGGGDQVRFSWTPLRADPALRGKADQQKARLSARIHDLVTVSETEVRSQVRVDMTILRNEVDRFTVRLPSGVEVEEVACANLAGWSESPRAERKDLLIRLSTPVSGSHTLNLGLTQPLKKVDSTWELAAPEVIGAERVKGSIGIGSLGGIEIQPAGSEGVRAIDVSELPSEVRDQASFALLRAFEFHRQPWTIRLETRKGQELPVLTATVDEASGLTLVTRDGKLVTSWTWQIRNNLKQSLEIRLPEGATLLTTTLDGQPARPVQGARGEIRLPLVASSLEGRDAFPVELTYVQEPPPPGLSGRHRLQAPRVDMPCSVMNWTVFLPLEEWIWHVGGTMQPGTIRSAPARSPGLPRNESAPEPAPEGRALRREVSKDEALKSAQLSGMVQQASRGTLPVKFNIPARGQSFQFSRLVLNPDESPEVLLYTGSQTLQAGLALLALGLTLALGWRQTGRERGIAILFTVLAGLWVVRGWTSDTPLGPALLWATRGLVLLMACWLYRNRAWILARLRGQGGEP